MDPVGSNRIVEKKKREMRGGTQNRLYKGKGRRPRQRTAVKPWGVERGTYAKKKKRRGPEEGGTLATASKRSFGERMS